MIVRNEKTYINTAATTQVASGPCYLEAIVVNTTTAATVGIIDGTSGTAVNVGQLVASAGVGRYEYNCSMNSGIRVVTGGAGNYTVIWRS